MRYETRDSRLIFDEFFKIERAMVRWEQTGGGMGGYRTRYAVRRGDSVGIVPVIGMPAVDGRTPERPDVGGGRVVLVRQFRYPAAKGEFDGFLWEIPAGMVRDGEDPAATAVRELLEETGVEADDMVPLISFFLSPGALDEKFHLYLARLPSGTPLRSVGGNAAEHEDLALKAFTIAELLSMIEGGEIVDAKTIASLLYCHHAFFPADTRARA